jgi:phosphonate transport system substrate-binding protein
MRHTLLKSVVIVILTVLGASCTPTAVNPSGADAATPTAPARPLIIGDISDEAAETIRGTQPLADYLAEQLTEFGITQGVVKIAPDLATMVEWVKNGEVDVYFDSPYPALVVSQEANATPILRRLKFGVPQYHSVFFTRADSPLTSLADLAGQNVAFEEPFSTSGYMLPLAYLEEQGYDAVEVKDLATAVAPDQVGYIFSTADNTTVQWVISGRVPAGVIDNVTLGRLPEETQAELRVFAATEDVPRQVVVVRAGLDEALVAQLKNLLLTMDENESGQAALELFLTTEFTEFPEGADAALNRMRELYQVVQENE